MKFPVMLTIRGQQEYPEQEPETVELITEGTMEQTETGWALMYEESDLTGLKGVTTTFFVEPEKITLSRKGPLTSQMVFREGIQHESLYQMEFGALLITVCANRVQYNISEEGGTIDLCYAIEIEQTATGFITYHLDIQRK